MKEILSDDLQDIAIGAGTLVLENGGETYRAEDTVVHVAKSMGAREANAFVTPTVVMFSYVDEEGKHHSSFKRIFKRGTNLSRLCQINDLSRRLVLRGKTSNPEQVKNLLHRIDRSPVYPDWMIVLMAAISSGFFTLMFDGSYFDGLMAFIFGGILRILLILLGKTTMGGNSFMMSLISGAFLSLMTDLLGFSSITCSSDLILIGAIMQCVPGLALTNGIRDIIAGDLMSGGARLLDAFMIATGLSIGSAAGIFIFRGMGV